MLTFIVTCTHTWCYATARSSATSTHTWCYAGVGWGGVGMLTFIVTCTHTWCYATARSSATSTHTWCYAGVGWGGVGMLTFIVTCTHTMMLRHCTFFCNFHTYVMLRWGGVGWGGDVNVHCHLHTYDDATPLHVRLQLPHIRDATLGWGGVGMLTFIVTCTHTWCYATARSSATSTHTWCYATARSSATSTHTWCDATAR